MESGESGIPASQLTFGFDHISRKRPAKRSAPLGEKPPPRATEYVHSSADQASLFSLVDGPIACWFKRRPGSCQRVAASFPSYENVTNAVRRSSPPKHILVTSRSGIG